MKIQSLAVIFVIIIVPISLILSEFTQTQIKNINIQSSYDSALLSATYDAVKAYEINDANNTSGDITNPKMRDIEASANTFLNSIKSHFKLSGNSSKAINDYIPAIVYTMYDGYYVYSPYLNDISGVYTKPAGLTTEENTEWDRWIENGVSYKDGERINGIKPYVYYSCRYVKTSPSIDVVITYSLDNYISIQGKINGNYINKSGYFLNKLTKNLDDSYSYNGVTITNTGEQLKEEIYDPDVDNGDGTKGALKEYPYIKENGTKYYCDDNNKIFYIQNHEKNYSQVIENEEISEYIAKINNNKSAYNFYKDAYGFTQDILTGELRALTFEDARDENGNSININGFNSSEKIFGGTKSAEEEDSNFSIHRTAVIRYAIEKNLTTAIANYDEKFGGDAAFSMPNLSEEDWYKLINDTSVITFLQGLPMGTRIYNGYAIVTNNKNKDVVTDYSIYISDGIEYHRVDENRLDENPNIANARGYLNTDFEKKTQDNNHYYYPRREIASYTSIVNQTNVAKVENLYDYLKDRSNLAKVYYTALGRERYSMARTGHGITEY